MKIVLATKSLRTTKAAKTFLESIPFPQGSELGILTAGDRRSQSYNYPRDRGSAALANYSEYEESEHFAASQADLLRGAIYRVSLLPVFGDPKIAVAQTASDWGADLILLESPRQLSGSRESQMIWETLARADCSVVFLSERELGRSGSAKEPGNSENQVRIKIVIYYDGSLASRVVVDKFSAWSFKDNAEIHLVRLIEPQYYHSGLFQKVADLRAEKWLVAERDVAQARRQLSAACPFITSELREVTKDNVHTLMSVAREQRADLIVLADKGLNLADQYLSDRLTYKLISLADMSLWVIKN